jgi:RimJ/RimL family protein N-acetyltransferase
MYAQRENTDGEYPAWWRRLEWAPWGVVLEPVAREHAPRVRRTLTVEIARWLGIGSVEDMRSGTPVWASEAAELARAGRGYRYLIHREGRFAGAIEVRPDAVKGHVGYWLRRAERGRGTVTLANRIVLLIAFDGMRLRAVDWTADEANAASIAVMQRLGGERVDSYRVRDLANRRVEVRYRVERSRYRADPTGPTSLRDLLT